MDKLVILCTVLCALLVPSYQHFEDTLIDDEDSASTLQVGIFVLELSSTYDCTDWQVSNQQVQMRNIILEALVQAVNGYCQCDFSRENVVDNGISCTENAGNAFNLIGEMRVTESPEVVNMSTLMKEVEIWAKSSPFFDVPVTLEDFNVVIRTTVNMATTTIGASDEGSGSGSGDHTTDMVTTTTPTITGETTEIETMSNETTTMEIVTTANVMSVNSTDFTIPSLNSFQPMKMSIITMVMFVLCSCLYLF